MNGKKYIDSIVDLLSALEVEIRTAGGLHLYDRHKHCEDFFKRFFNLLYGYNLINVNFMNGNFPAIDLGDAKLKKCIQVTSDSSTRKIQETIATFISKNLYEHYDNLTILIITQKKDYNAKSFDTKSKFNFDPKRDIMDKEDLIKEIAAYDNLDKIKRVYEFLQKELGAEKSNTTASEVETIMDFISFLSESREDEKDVPTSDPDPERKIMQRFANHAAYLRQELQDYIPIYQTARIEAENKLGLDKAMVTLIRRFLMDKSVVALESSNQDPKKALEELVSYFASDLSKNGKTYDYGAIRYYLLQEIIRCNVFPNPLN